MSDCSLHLDYLRVPGRVYQELASLTMTQSLYIAKGKPRSHRHSTPASSYTGQRVELHGEQCGRIRPAQVSQVLLIHSCHCVIVMSF